MGHEGDGPIQVYCMLAQFHFRLQPSLHISSICWVVGGGGATGREREEYFLKGPNCGAMARFGGTREM